MQILDTTDSYCADHRIDPGAVKLNCGWLALLHCKFDGHGGFAADPDEGVDAAVIQVLDEHHDFASYCAWPVVGPDSFAVDVQQDTLFAPLLGEWNLHNPASWAFGERLMVHCTPLRWLKAGCQGVVVLDHQIGFQRLRQALGPLEAENEAHARVLHTLMNPDTFAHGIWVPV